MTKKEQAIEVLKSYSNPHGYRLLGEDNFEVVAIAIDNIYAKEAHKRGNYCHTCGDVMSNECSRCKKLWES